MHQRNRLSKNWQFQRIIKINRQIVTKYLVIYFVPNNVSAVRIGISISKKFAHAVERNRQRRQTRAALDMQSALWFDSGKAFDIVLMLRKPFLDASYEKKLKALNEAITQLG